MRAGDHVFHAPSGETWVLATDPENGRVEWCGWPPGDALEADCKVTKACTDEEHEKMLVEWGETEHRSDRGTLDARHLRAKRQLLEWRKAHPLPG